ncbi:helix-turn-helix transcriptional regulator [Streptomyces sp. NPDC053367]|uniref:helix-turn-helix transcriptional regulator n=1 Tax=Streptomyces sp. NPDC053367 TaxID=3365700 RepID=UPI0037CE69F3
MHDLLYNVKQIREDVVVPKNPEHEGSPRLMTVTEIAAEHGVSRQTIHTYRRTGIFPSPVAGEGSTRPRFREDEVAAFFEANPKQPRKKRRPQPEQQGETAMSVYTVTLRVEADSEVTPEQIRQEIYDAGSELPFGFDITEVSEAQDG